MEKAFGVELNEYEHPEGSYRGRIGAINMPDEYSSIISGVFGLDDRPAAQPHIRYHLPKGTFGARATSLSFNPNQVGALYGFPTNVDVSSQTIGIIELGGGYRPADIRHYFNRLGIASPTVKAILVDHARNRPTTPDSADGEVMLDIEVAGAVAPGDGSRSTSRPTPIAASSTLSTAIHDKLNKPSVISISWGGPESTWTAQAMQPFDQASRRPRCWASPSAWLPATTARATESPTARPTSTSRPRLPTCWPAAAPACAAGTATSLGDGLERRRDGGATGGGVSDVFAEPAYQTGAFSGNVRGVPDVAGDADPETGYNVLVDGHSMVIGGTSAVAPLWAGLVALMNQKLGPPSRLPQPAPLPPLAQRDARHHAGQQRQLPRRTRMGSHHRQEHPDGGATYHRTVRGSSRTSRNNLHTSKNGHCGLTMFPKAQKGHAVRHGLSAWPSVEEKCVLRHRPSISPDVSSLKEPD